MVLKVTLVAASPKWKQKKAGLGIVVPIAILEVLNDPAVSKRATTKDAKAACLGETESKTGKSLFL